MTMQWAHPGRAPKTDEHVSGTRFTLSCRSQGCGKIQVNYLRFWILGNPLLKTDGLLEHSRDKAKTTRTSDLPGLTRQEESPQWKPSHSENEGEASSGRKQGPSMRKTRQDRRRWLQIPEYRGPAVNELESLWVPPRKPQQSEKEDICVQRDMDTVLLPLRATCVLFQSAKLSSFNFLIKKQKKKKTECLVFKLEIKCA